MSIKSQLLKLFIYNRNEILSGEFLADKLQVSRNSIWKAVNSLRDEGYQIQSSQGQGYQLTRLSRNLDAQQISAYLSLDSLSMEVMILDQTPSTNDLAKEYIGHHRNGVAFFVAKKQTHGRGRYGKTFYSNLDKGLYCSLVFPVDQQIIEEVSLYTIFAAVAIIEAIEEHTELKLEVKWVNDIFLNQKKVGGILSEGIVSLENRRLEHIIVGLGLNLAGSFEKTDQRLNQIATTLFGESIPDTVNINRLIYLYVRNFMTAMTMTRTEDILASYRQHMLGVGRQVSYTYQGQPYQGRLLGINQKGHLIVENPAGQEQELFGGEIQIGSEQFVGGSNEK